jgi:heptosyltransferase-2
MKILIIKLGALGDVVRTLSILPALKEKYPDSEIHWVTKKNAEELFEGNPYISKVHSLSSINEKEKFDLLINLDIESEASELAQRVNAERKLGFYSQEGFPSAFNLGAEYYINTIFDDELKKANKKTYQEMIFEASELKYRKHHCPLFLINKDKEYAENFIDKNKINTSNILGIHMGASSRWPSKIWHEDNLIRFIAMAKNMGFDIILFAGKDEKDKQKNIIDKLNKEGIKIYQNNPDNSIKEFASLVNLCKKMICSDSFSLHISLALKKPTIGLFFCTSPEEIEDYGLLKKIISPKLGEFFPSRMDEYNEDLVKSISIEKVLENLDKNK